jgi:hypothetical protein
MRITVPGAVAITDVPNGAGRSPLANLAANQCGAFGDPVTCRASSWVRGRHRT